MVAPKAVDRILLLIIPLHMILDNETIYVDAMTKKASSCSFYVEKTMIIEYNVLKSERYLAHVRKLSLNVHK